MEGMEGCIVCLFTVADLLPIVGGFKNNAASLRGKHFMQSPGLMLT